MGLAVYSGVILDVPLPLVMFKKVLGEQLSLKVNGASALTTALTATVSPGCQSV